jgi:hypothetical protein
MPQCTPTQYNNKGGKKEEEEPSGEIWGLQDQVAC